MKLYEFKEDFDISKTSKNKPQIKVAENFWKDDEEKESKGYIVTIEAIHAITTANYNTYLAKELRAATNTWLHPYQKPVLTHHNSRDGEPIGRVLEAKYSDTSQAGLPVIILTVEITDKKAIEKIKDGRYQTVSIGGHAEHAYCSICGNDWIEEGWCEHWPGQEYDGKIATLELGDLTFVEVSFVNVPADSHAMIVDVEEGENGEVTKTESLRIEGGEIITEQAQGGNNMGDENKNVKNLEESLKLKEEKVEVLETKVNNLETANQNLTNENKSLNEKNEVLETKVENLETELGKLTEENADLKNKQHKILAEKVVAKKVALGKVKEEDMDELVTAHIERTEESLNDTLADLEYEESLVETEEEVIEPGEQESNPGIHNANEESSVKTEENDRESKSLEDEFAEIG